MAAHAPKLDRPSLSGPARSSGVENQKPRFNVILEGNTAPNLTSDRVAIELAKLTRTSPKHAKLLLAGKSTTIKANVSSDVAQRCLMTLLEIGAIAHIEPIHHAGRNNSPPEEPNRSNTTCPSQKDSGSQPFKNANPATSIDTPHELKVKTSKAASVDPEHTNLNKGVRSPHTDYASGMDSTAILASLTSKNTGQTTESNLTNGPVETNTQPRHFLSEQAIREAINQPVVCNIHQSIVGKITLYMIALGALSLPFIYLGSLMAVVLALQWHVHTNTDWLWSASSPITAILYIFPIVFGTGFLVLMAKPIMAPSETTEHTVPLDFVKDATVLALVERVAAAVGTRPPLEVRFSWQSVVIAESRSGIMRYIRNRPIVTIGLPLIGELKTNQLVHLLATELIRFSRRRSFSLLRLLEQVHVLLYHAAFERDMWDTKLDQMIQRSTDFKVVTLLSLKALIEMTRLPMAILSQVCQLLTGRHLATATLNFDRYAASLAGSEDARSALTRQYFLSTAEKLVIDDVYHSLQTGRRIENIPDTVLRKSKSLPIHIINQIRRSANRPNKGAMGVYPSLAERITALSALPSHTRVHLPNPAIELLPRYNELCNILSRMFYAQLGLTRQRSSQLPSHRLDQYEKNLVNRYFRGCFRNDRILVPQVSSHPVPGSTLGLTNAIRAVIRDMRGTRHSVTEVGGQNNSGSTLDNLALRRLGLVLQVRLNYSNNIERRMLHGQIESLKSLDVANPALDRLLQSALDLHNHPLKHKSLDREVQQLLKRCRDSYAALLGILVKGTYPFHGGNNPTLVLSFFQHNAGSPDVMIESAEHCLASVNAVTRNIRNLHRGIIASLIETANETEKQLGVTQSSIGSQADIDTQSDYSIEALGVKA